MTSANVINYLIRNKDGTIVETHRQHLLCKTHWGDLLKFTPPEDFTITSTWLDEDERYFQDEPRNLKNFIEGLEKCKAKFNTSADWFKKILVV